MTHTLTLPVHILHQTQAPAKTEAPVRQSQSCMEIRKVAYFNALTADKINIPSIHFFVKTGVSINVKNAAGDTGLHVLLKRPGRLDMAALEALCALKAKAGILDGARKTAMDVFVSRFMLEGDLFVAQKDAIRAGVLMGQKSCGDCSICPCHNKTDITSPNYQNQLLAMNARDGELLCLAKAKLAKTKN